MKRSWTKEQLESAVRESRSIRQVLGLLGLRQAGGNYSLVKRHIEQEGFSIAHMTGPAWNRGMKIPREPIIPLSKILRRESLFQSHKLKNRLFTAGIKQARCEECGWCQVAQDGRLPLELDHVNGDRFDNRIENLRILCPNCHSLKPTHRGRNIKKGKNKPR